MLSDFETSVLNHVTHRPWPVPDRPWVMTQTWHDLVFLHWPVDPIELRSRIPSVFDLDLLDGAAWLGIVPFRMTNVGPRGLPALPIVSAFPELNVRTYVRVADRPGVYFFSLDAGSALAVATARLLFNLPYYAASMTLTLDDGIVEYVSRRTRGSGARLRATYGPVSPAFTAAPGSLEHFLTERYCLYAIDHRGRPYRLDIHHPPWLLHRANASIVDNTMAAAAGVSLPDAPPHALFAKRQDVVAWMPERLLAAQTLQPRPGH
jgi:uncharacterized protein YqjF (DUF2071 family)